MQRFFSLPITGSHEMNESTRLYKKVVSSLMFPARLRCRYYLAFLQVNFRVQMGSGAFRRIWPTTRYAGLDTWWSLYSHFHDSSYEQHSLFSFIFMEIIIKKWDPTLGEPRASSHLENLTQCIGWIFEWLNRYNNVCRSHASRTFFFAIVLLALKSVLVSWFCY